MKIQGCFCGYIEPPEEWSDPPLPVSIREAVEEYEDDREEWPLSAA